VTVARDKGLRSLLEKRLPLTIRWHKTALEPPVGTKELVIWEDTAQEEVKLLIRVGNTIHTFATKISIDITGAPGGYFLDVTNFGALGNGSGNDQPYIQLAIDAAETLGGATVYFPGGDYLIGANYVIDMKDNVEIVAAPGTTIYKNAQPSAKDLYPLIRIKDVSHTRLKGIKAHMSSFTNQNGLIQIEGTTKHVTIEEGHLYNGYSGVWVKGGSDIRIFDTEVYNCSHPIYLGENFDLDGSPTPYTLPATAGTVQGILIQGCNLHDALSGGDGIKTVSSAQDLSVTNCWIHDNAYDGIDLFVSGDQFTIQGCIIEGNGNSGLDLKANEDAYQEASWGKNRQGTVQGNVIRGNGDRGIKIAKLATYYPYLFVLDGNVVLGNTTYGIECYSHYNAIVNNIVAANGASGTGFSGIYLNGTQGTTYNNTVANNLVVNNGVATANCSGINIQSCTRVAVMGNVLDYDAYQPNGASKTQNWGITIGATCTNVSVIANQFGTGLDIGLNDSGTDTERLANSDTVNYLNKTLWLRNGAALAILGTVGNLTLSSEGHKVLFSYAGGNIFEATSAGGKFVFRPNAAITNRLEIDSTGIQVEGITTTDTINETTTDAGVTIESILLENGFIELTEVSSPSTPTSNKARLFLSTTTGELRLLKDSGDEVTVENTGWDDVRVNANAVKTQGASNLPSFGEFPASSGLYTWVFDGTATMEQVYFSVQLPHRYKAGSDIKPHVHYCPTDNSAGTVKWFLDYVWQNVNGTFASSATTISGTDEVGANSIRDHLVCGLGTITGTGMKESSMLLCRLYRTPSDGDDDYAADVAFLEFDIHYECEKMGTTNEYPS